MKKTMKITALLLAVVMLFCNSNLAFAAEKNEVPDEVGIVSHPGKLVTLDDIAAHAKTRKSGAKGALGSETKTIPFLCIVIGFSNIPYLEDANWNERLFNGDTSLQQYYLDMSLNQFTFVPASESSVYSVDGNTNTADAVNDGIVHINLDMEHDNWTSLNDKTSSTTLYSAFADAVIKADEYVDFAAYDTDGDGEIENNEMALGFIVAGYEASTTETFDRGVTSYLWAHAWGLSGILWYCDLSEELPYPDGVLVSDYIAISEMLDDGSLSSTGVFAHELGHYLGLPDLYDTSYGNYGEFANYAVEFVSVMASGSWGYNEDFSPATYSFDIWSRCELGWVTPQEVTSSGTYSVKAQDFSGDGEYTVLKIPINKHEYYLIENRQFNKWDSGMPSVIYKTYGKMGISGGIIVWHIDEQVYNQYRPTNGVNDSSQHRPAIMPIYIEKDENSNRSFIGTHESDSIITGCPFYDKAFWNEYLTEIEGGMNLPAYGRGANADLRAARTYSGIRLEFIDNADTEMNVKITVPEKEPENAFSLSLDNNIFVNIIIDADFYGEDAYAAIEYNHNSNVSQTPDFKTDTVKLSELTLIDDPTNAYYGARKLSVLQAPAQSTEPITVKIYASQADVGDESKVVDTIEFSIYDYFREIIEDYNGAMETELKNLAKTTLDYAASAQNYFDYNTDNMATKDVQGGFYNDVNSFDMASVNASASAPGCIQSFSVVVKSDLEINLLSRTPINVTSASIDANSSKFAVSSYQKDGWYVVHIEGIEPANMDNTFTVETDKGEIQMSANYIMKLMANSSDEKLVSLAKAMYLYGAAANVFFE